MERLTFGRSHPNIQRGSDRFVPPRSALGERQRQMHHIDQKLDTDDVWATHFQHKKRFSTLIDDVFGFEQANFEQPWGQADTSGGVQNWPCVPRKKKFLASADSVLDLPHYRLALFPELLDWSSDDILVAALGRNYYKWSWGSQSLVSRGITQSPVDCCKFDPTGELLALGTSNRSVEIHKTELSKCIAGNYCRCWKLDNEHCSITAVDWSPTGNSFVIGCSRGLITAFTRDAQVVTYRRVCQGAIILVRISPDARFVVASAVAGQHVMVLTWNTLLPYSTLVTDWTLTTLAWHPWRSALLGVGGLTPERHTAVALWDAAPGKTRHAMQSPSPCHVDSMLFSHRTGEMVLSLCKTDTPIPVGAKHGSRIVVLSDPDTVVDQWGEGKHHLDRVRTMVFSPDGTKLATATTEEDLIIWNFLPEEKKKGKIKKRRFSALPVYLDESILGFSIR